MLHVAGLNLSCCLEDYIETALGRFSRVAGTVASTPFFRLFARMHASSVSLSAASPWQAVLTGYISHLRRHNEVRRQIQLPNFGASGYRIIGWTPICHNPNTNMTIDDGYNSSTEKRFRVQAKEIEYSIITTIMYDFICFLMLSPVNLHVGPAYQVEVAIAVTYVYRLQTGIDAAPARYEKGHMNFMTQVLRHVPKAVLIRSGVFRSTTATGRSADPWRLKPFKYWLHRMQTTRPANELAQESLLRLPSLHAPHEHWKHFHQRVTTMLTAHRT